MQEELLTAAQHATHGSSFVPGLAITGFGIVMTVLGVYRNDAKRKAGVAIVGLIITLTGTGIMLYVR